MKATKLTNPFPGLRPFTREESHLFFGREGQVENVARNLLENQFVAVIGSSGSGKSSLIYCGVLSEITRKGKWNVILTRPGSDPFKNLFNSLSESLGKKPDELPGTEEYSSKLKELITADHRESKSEYLIVIDQFEEVFRYRKAGGEDESFNIRGKYVDLLVELVENSKLPVNIIITMRSDFIGECSRFQDFTSLINKSNYLIPRMSGENFKRVIEEPVKIAGSTVHPDLVERILREMGDNQDQLPILQHALMRTWNYWKENSNPDQAISVNDYEAVGGIARALSDHANEAFDELNQEEKTACERIFRSLTEKGNDNRGVRRPTTVKDLSRISEFPVSSVIKILNVFRAEGRSFLIPSTIQKLDGNSVIDLSHEALMRIWDRLNNWVDEESAAVTMYKRLSESAGLYQTGKTGLWRPPDLHLAVNWKNKNNPNLAWAVRHDPAFERTIVFLDTSREEFEKEEANKIRLQKLRLRRTRMFALVLGAAAIVSLVMFLYTRQLSVDLEQQYEIAETNRIQAVDARKDAEDQKQVALDALEEANIERARADTARNIAEEQRKVAVQNAEIAKTQTRLAQEREEQANQARLIAQQNAIEAQQQRDSAELARNEAFSRRMLSISKSLSVKSQQTSSDPELKSLLALQAYKFNQQYKGDASDIDLYYGLYNSVKMILGQDFNQYTGHNKAVRSVKFLSGTKAFFSTGGDGRILKWNLDSANTDFETVLEGRNEIVRLEIASDNEFLLAAENNAGLLRIDLNDGNYNLSRLNGEELNIRSLVISKDNKTAYTAGLNNFIEIRNLENGSSRRFVETASRVSSLALSPDGQMLAACFRDGSTSLWNTGAPEESIQLFRKEDGIFSVKFSPDGNYLACGKIKGGLILLDANDYSIIAELSGHEARVTEISFSPDNRRMLTTSYDGKVIFWNMDDLTVPPIEFSDNKGFVWSGSFSSDGKYFVTGSSEPARLVVRPAESGTLADSLFPRINRNLTEDEWGIYVGKDIKQEETIALEN